MNDNNQANGPDGRPDQALIPDPVQFCSIEEMQETSEAAGWSVEYRQLQAGRLKAHAVTNDCASISLIDEAASRRIELTGQSPAGHVTVFAPVGQSRMWVNGQLVDSQAIFLLNSSSEIHLLSDPDTRVLSMHIPTTFLDEVGGNLFDRWDTLRYVQGKINGNVSQIIQQIKMLIATAIHRPVSAHAQPERELACKLAELYCQSTEHSSQSTNTVQHNSMRTLGRALEYIEAHIDESYSMAELCCYSAASLSKVERIFRRELEVTPVQYVLARRLAAARRELIRRNPNDSQVSRIAMKFGFHHLGRFSGAYRSKYGELPSESLRSS